jgi:hypothetical protein
MSRYLLGIALGSIVALSTTASLGDDGWSSVVLPGMNLSVVDFPVVTPANTTVTVHAIVSSDYEVNFVDGYRQGYSSGYNIGFDSGTTRGQTEGDKNGQAAGYPVGWNVAYQPAYDRGYADQYPIGNKIGWDEGMKSGFDSGVEWAKTVRSMSAGITCTTGSYGSLTIRGLGATGSLVGSGVSGSEFSVWREPSDAEQYFNLGFSNGNTDGFKSGSTEGYNQAYPAAYDAGYTIGYDKGTTEGDAKGVVDGGKKGYSNGWDKGHEEGYQKGFDLGVDSIVSTKPTVTTLPAPELKPSDIPPPTPALMPLATHPDVFTGGGVLSVVDYSTWRPNLTSILLPTPVTLTWDGTSPDVAVPEPSSILLAMLAGIVSTIVVRRRSRCGK